MESTRTHMHTRFFCTFGTDLYAKSVFINKISALELSQKFIKSALLVGQERKSWRSLFSIQFLLGIVGFFLRVVFIFSVESLS